MFTIFLQYYSKLLLVNKKKKKYKIDCKFKSEPVKTYHLDFVVKVLQKCFENNNYQKLPPPPPPPKKKPKISNQTFNCNFFKLCFQIAYFKITIFYIKKMHTF